MHWSVVGHDEQKRYLERLLDEGRLPHALLLAGPEGVGKRMVAEDILAALVPPGYPLDVMRLAPTRDEETGKLSNIPVDDVRALLRWLPLRPSGVHKAVLLDGAERLGHDAANTLLKALEEPPAYVRFLLVTSAPADVLPTISSRCERVDFRPLDADHMRGILKGLKLDDDDRALLATVAAGRPGAALRLAEAGQLPAVARHIAALEKSLKAGVAERLVYAREVADDDHADDIVAWWLAYVHGQLPRRPELAVVGHGLIDLYRTVADPVYNRKLAVEHFLLSVAH